MKAQKAPFFVRCLQKVNIIHEAVNFKNGYETEKAYNRNN